MAKQFTLERIVISERTGNVLLFTVWEKKGIRWIQRNYAKDPKLCEWVTRCKVGTLYKIGEGGKGRSARYRLFRTK